MRFFQFVFVLLFPAFLFGCATGETEVPTLGKTPAPLPASSPAPPPGDEPPADAARDRIRDRSPSMTEVLRERGIPDRVANEDANTIWIYESPEGEEIFTFGEKGRFVSFETRKTRPDS